MKIKLILSILFLSVGLSAQTFQSLQITQSAGSSNTIANAAPVNVPAGATVILCVGQSSNTATAVMGITDGGSNTLTRIRGSRGIMGTSPGGVEMWYKPNAVANAAATFTATFTGNFLFRAHILSIYTNTGIVDQSSCNDATCLTDTDSANRTDANVTTTATNELATACSYERDLHTFTPANAFNLRSAASGIGVAWVDKNIAAIGSYPNGNWATVTGGAFNNYVSVFATFQSTNVNNSIISGNPTPTQVKLAVPATNTNPCVVEASESPTYLPLVNDVNPALFTGAAAGHVKSGAGIAGRREIVIGLRTSELDLNGKWTSRALGQDTQHYIRVTNCVTGNLTDTFITDVPKGISPEGPPTAATATSQLAYPEFDSSDYTKPVIDPHSGIRIWSANPTAWSFASFVPVSANWWTGGTNWTNLANIPSYGTAVASATTTDTLTILLDTLNYSDQTYVTSGYWPFDNFMDVCIDTFGSATDAAAGNRTLQFRLSVDSGQTFVGNPATLVLPTGANVAAGITPSICPSAFFRGWGKALQRNAWPRRGSATVATGLVTITKDVDGTAIGGFHSPSAYLDPSMPSGIKMFIAGSPCANSICTTSAPPVDATHVQLVENFNLGENVFRVASLAIVVNKTTAIGTASASFRFKLAKALPNNVWSGGCALNTVVSVDSITGYPCILPRTRQDTGVLYLLGSSAPLIRVISPFANASLNCTNVLMSDCPNSIASAFGPTVPAFDSVNPAIMYKSTTTNAGDLALFRINYVGNWSAYNQPFVSTSANLPNTAELTWTNITPVSSGMGLRAQILANTTYSEAEFGALTTIQEAGITADKIIFQKVAGGAQNAACWIFEFTAATGTFFRAYNTSNDPTNDTLHYSGCHAIIPLNDSTTPAILLSNNNLTFNNAAVPFGGPFTGTITAVKKAGVFNANTSLPWPIDGTYDNTCPAGMPAFLVARGATPASNQCVQVRGTYPCSAVPAAGEAAAHPCPYDAAKSYLGPFKVGDWFHDNSNGLDNDSEGFGIGIITDLGAGTFEATLERNANFARCSIGTPATVPPRDGAESVGQLQHTNGWTFTAVARDACFSQSAIINLANNTLYTLNQQRTQGHSAYPTTSNTPPSTTLVASGAPNYDTMFNRAWPNLNSFIDWNNIATPLFSGFDSSNGTVQSYVDGKHPNASLSIKRLDYDIRHYNGNTGVELEQTNQFIGVATTATLQGGTTHVYKVTFTGTLGIKYQSLRVWAGFNFFTEKSSAATGNQITDADNKVFCVANAINECRTGAAAGDLYVSMAGLQTANIGGTNVSLCNASQVTLSIICAMSGPAVGMQAFHIMIDRPDLDGIYQRFLGNLLGTPGTQYVYDQFLPTPDGKYLMFGGFLINGYQSSLMMMELPQYRDDTTIRNGFEPVLVKTTCGSCYVEFGYEEFGNPLANQYYCTQRADGCRVVASPATFNPAAPFAFASAGVTPVMGAVVIQIPALPGRILHYRIVDNGTPREMVTTPVR